MSRPKRLANGLSSLPAGTDPEAVRFLEPTGEPVDLEQLAASSPAPAPAQQQINAVEDGPQQIGDLPLFSGQSWESGNAPNTIRVTRVGPVGEGVLGTIDLTATEHDIRSKWGGGEYRIEVCNSRSFTIRGGTKIIKIAGEPMIQSDLYRAEYIAMVRNRNGSNNNYGQQQQQQPAAAAAAPLPPLPVAVSDGGMPGMLGMMMTFLQMQADSQRAALQRENESAAQREAMQFKFFELFSKNNEKKQDTYDPLAQLERLFKLRRLVEGKAETAAEPDATSKIIDALPGVFSEVKEMIQMEKGGVTAAANGAITPAMVEAVLAHVGKSDDVLILDAPIGLIANKATKRLADANIDPAAVLVHFFTQLVEQPMDAIRVSLGIPREEKVSAPQTEATAPKSAESAGHVAVTG